MGQNQRNQYKLHLEGKKSHMTSRIQALESLGFEWEFTTAWEDRLSELADYRKSTALQCSHELQRKQAG
jgi:hypothetical protein